VFFHLLHGRQPPPPPKKKKKKKKKYSRRAGNALENFSRNKKMKRVERTKQHWSKQIKFPLL
jgi:hypothetical protein